MSTLAKRIGRHANPGGIVVHIRATPSGRLLDVCAVSPEQSGDVHEGRFELEDDEDGIAVVPYSGDSGRLILPPSEESYRRLDYLGRVGTIIISFSLVLNVSLFAINAMRQQATAMIINVVCVLVGVIALCSNLRLRQQAKQRRAR